MSAFKVLNRFSLIKVTKIIGSNSTSKLSFVFFLLDKNLLFYFFLNMLNVVLENYVDILTKPKEWKEDKNYDDIAASLYTIIYSCYLDRKPLQEEKVPKLIYILDGISSSK